ncbi:SPW repeat protein [Streptomyces globisporus]|uniref:SPW repeat protein n=1 Tax=Streptomyces TaxID=1883 RepID=UPI0013C0901A|nr:MULTISPECIES: SPW repeat protein [unclassified Streptomyces]NED05081.1 SPW repeat protein [Streptomyces sp. SID6648]MBK3562126.1 SPW repeat protein [Streptomyces sp. MBT56]MBK3602206.1 SPW repeat protein [Streptomyces sp. MBT54]MBK3614699.1 SPW repeat protein [Streptomyces sp. MBT98]MBK6041056.1 SPW repeat protein [Streptomyces sp. MBT55]
MSNVSHARSDLSGHPDASEMRARYDRVMGGRDVALVDAPVFLVGLYCAVSPWVLHFTASQPALVTHNLVMGIAIAVLALGFTVMPERMYGLSWAICAIGAWIIVSTWVVGSSPDAGIVINNIIVGGLTVLLGMVCAGATTRTRST